MFRNTHKRTNLFRPFGLRFRARTGPLVLPLALCLLAVNLFYSMFLVGQKVNPGSRRVARELQSIERETRHTVQGWLDSKDDTLYIQRLWYGDIPSSWNDRGISLLLFRDSSMVYWSNYDFQPNINSFWLTPSHTIRQVGTYQVLTLLQSRNGKSAVVSIALRDRETDRYNPWIFPEQRITLLPTTDSLRARLVQARLVEAAGNSFYIEAKPMQSMPWWAELCGWCAVLLLCLHLKNIVRRHTTRHNAFLNAGILLPVYCILRVGLHYAGIPNANGVLFQRIYGLHNLILGSLGDLLLSYGILFIYIAYLFQVRAKLNWQYRRFTPKGRTLTAFACCALTALIIAVFHYALIMSIYTPKINIQIYDIFDLTYISAMFYLLTVLFVSIRLLIAHTGLTLFGTRKMALRIGVTAALILLILWPIENRIHSTGYILAAFYLASAGADYVRLRYKHYGSFVISLLVFSAYIACFATMENTSAQNNAQKLYARILATTPHDRAILRSELQTTGELSTDIRFRNFTYARIIDDQITFKHGNSNDYQGLASSLPPGRDTTLTHNGQTHFIYNYYSPDGQHGMLLISRKATTILDAVSLYVYIFLLLFILCGLLLEIAGYSFDIQRLGTRMTFKIRAVVIGVVLFAMLAVTWVIIGHTLSGFRSEKRRFVNNNMQRLGYSIAQYLQDTTLDQRTAREWLSSEQNDLDYSISLFDPNGNLIATSAENPLNANRMNSSAYRYLRYLGRPFYVTDTDQSQYTSAFAPIVTHGTLRGYLNLQYYSPSASNSFLQHELLSDILNLFLIILCIAVIFSELLYRLLTKPFNQLHEAMGNISKMQKIDAVGSSRKISDEVGMLVEQYNTMIDYLEESYRQLARSEREGAWREMARQVAHEIKNPLTPMRLKIQMLQRSMQENDCEALRPKVESTLSLLLDQIDLLNKIASEFSDFAKIGEGHPTRVDLIPLVCNVAKLYSGYDNIGVRLHFECDCDLQNNSPSSEAGEAASVPLPVGAGSNPIWVTADPDHLTRVFVNICQNAAQAMAGQKHAWIDIDLRIMCGRAWISFRDNGPGIPEEIQKRIFTPNFTTKSSGSGLGLALSRKIVELLGGHIAFESTVGVGTIFTIDLPIDTSPESRE